MIVDPVPVDTALYALITAQELPVTTLLVTHPEPYMAHAIRTIRRIWDVNVIAGGDAVYECAATGVADAPSVDAAGIRFDVVAFPSHSHESVAYRIPGAVFTGTIIHAGTIGATPGEFAEALLVAAVKDYLFTGDERAVMLAAVGPPTTLRAEHHLAPYYRDGESP